MVVKVNGMQVILFGHSTVKGEDLSFKKGEIYGVNLMPHIYAK